ncbi:hypothetical protein CVT26_011884 [Gymnopilus dilepis]|uniref:Uncharacterized protein n=1 Tax=Gymnopilus dilepis TaxID=231916 RepID=A0A409W5I3_9AGAR|nr:hypothetical protein CVT26_011884 [Gymnopilus dilepis]
MEGGGGGSPYSSYNGTPVTGTFTPSAIQSPYLSAGAGAPGSPSLLPPGTPGSAVGLGYPQSTFGPPPTPGSMARASSLGPPPPRTPGYSPSHTPRSPSVGFAGQQAQQGNGTYASPAPPPYSPLVPTHDATAQGGATSAPGTPGAAYASFPSHGHGHSGSVDGGNNANGNGVRVGPPPPRGGKKDD